jgi:hypothetical protein
MDRNEIEKKLHKMGEMLRDEVKAELSLTEKELDSLKLEIEKELDLEQAKKKELEQAKDKKHEL